METIDMGELVDRVRNGGKDDTLDEWLKWSLIELSVQKGREVPLGKHPIIFDIECKINGIEVMFSKVIESILGQYKSALERKGQTIFEEKRGKQFEIIETATNLFLEKLGVSREDVDQEMENW